MELFFATTGGYDTHSLGSCWTGRPYPAGGTNPTDQQCSKIYENRLTI
jgi:hypothetical protein